MAYKFTKAQRKALHVANTVAVNENLPPYTEVLFALTDLVVAVRGGKPTLAPMARASGIIEEFRNDSATRPRISDDADPPPKFDGF